MEEKFKERIKQYSVLWEAENRVYGQIANLRLVTLLACLYVTYLMVKIPNHLMVVLVALIAYSAFIYLVYKHQKVKEKLESYESMRLINEKYVKRLNGEWHHFEDRGEELIDESHPYALDLDILGERSLFQKINTTHTWYGRKRLAQVLLGAQFKEDTLVERQKAVKELMQDLDFCQKIEGATSKRKKVQQSPTRLLDYVKTEATFLKSNRWDQVVAILPWITVSVIVLGYFLKSSVLGIGVIILMLGGYGLQFFYALRISAIKSMLSSALYDLNEYVHILEVIKEKEFTSPYLKELSNRLFNKENSALSCLKELEKISSRSNVTHQPIVAIPLDAILLWDLKVVLRLEAWRKTYGGEIEHYLEAIGELESLISLSILGHIEEQIVFPLVEETGKYVKGSRLGHPLINKETRVCNDVNMENEIFVITGSNMSGKTTFLRTIGINLILAYAGAPVVAEHLSCSKMEIYTSMRIRDDLTHGISTFYAELTRIKKIIEAAKTNKQMLFLIDEIFRGTNSADRIIGATSVVKTLDHRGSIGAITTHDMELCQLSESGKVANYHFSERYTEDTIKFDYEIKEGPSTTTNAKYLMKMVGIDLIQ